MESAFRRETRAALAALPSETPADGADAARLLPPLERIGDALRLGLELPATAARWLSLVPVGALGPVFDALRVETSEWSLPTGAQPLAQNAQLAQAVCRRDQAESVIVAAARVCARKGIVPGHVQGYAPLRTALGAFDVRLRAVADRASLEALLGTRVEGLDAVAWTSAFDDAIASAIDDAASDLPAQIAFATPPSDDVVSRYLAQGAGARRVEGFAAHDASFAGELAETFDVLHAAGEPLALKAWGWRRRQRGGQAAHEPIGLPIRPRLALAAATGDAPEQISHEYMLGELAPLRAHARVVCTAHEATIRIAAAPGEIAHVQLGDVMVDAPARVGLWAVTARLTDAALPFVVVGTTGETFSAELRFDPHEATE